MGSDERDYLRLVLTARVYNVAKETPLQLAKTLSKRLNHQIYLKREDLQTVFSFKLRGAYNRMYHLAEDERQRGVIACSAGNHAQGVALSAQQLGIKATIVMPVMTPDIKVRAARSYGANVVLHGNDFDEAKKECYRLAGEHGYVIIPPFDDPYVIAGQGTVGVEILRQMPTDKLDAVFAAVGGGGLLSGIAAYIKRIRPDVRIIGVEAEDAAAMTESLKQGHRVELSEVGLFADGAAVRLVGEETFKLCQRYVDDMVVVSNDQICAAIKDTFEDTRSILEPAGALALAGAKKWLEQQGQQDLSVVCVTSGANMNFDRLRFVAERAELGEAREVLMSARIPEKPGSFLKLHNIIHPRNVTEFSYRYSDLSWAVIFIAFEVANRETEAKQVLDALAENGMEGLDLTSNEMAKTHAHYLAGGRSSTVTNERLFRFEFPERPGALKRFLHCLPNTFNVSLFHYRNHGADVGRVLAGIQVPSGQEQQFQEFLSHLNYPYHEETQNPVYQYFLK